MLKSALLWASTNPTLARRLPRYRFVRQAVKRFMPGEEMEDALRAGEALGAAGTPTLVTELGENVDTLARARAVVDRYRALSEAIVRRGLDMELSVKPTHLGLDQGREVTASHLVEIARDAPGLVWVDMEASGYVDATLDVFRAAREEAPNLGICLQAYLHRTEDDYDALLPLKPAIRLVKGAYLEPPDVAMSSKAQVDEGFRRLATRMLRDRANHRLGRPGIGTHDDRLIRDAARVTRELGLESQAWEVEMLYGIATGEQARLREAGIPLRVLISYGEHWFPWYMRRLAERPANVGFVLKQLVRR